MVINDKPSGVRKEPVKEGRILLWDTSSVVDITTVPTNIGVDFDDISSQDNILLDFATTLQFQINDPVKLVSNFGVNWFENNVKPQYATIVRDAVKARTMSQLMSDPDTAANVDRCCYL